MVKAVEIIRLSKQKRRDADETQLQQLVTAPGFPRVFLRRRLLTIGGQPCLLVEPNN